ncbi:MAG: UDP-N-acetylmuramate--L-alanine ligase [Christensenellaceae bacterium]|jgi:UDP-N-acetylmuramate--alanine ligase|nr:UDP-N-acetylmuramate--L-alanine ligase [Christensenellaceae bacterium]
MSNLDSFKHIHFIGAGGISMSALAKLMLLWGKKVTGSDIRYSDEVCELIQWGANIAIGHDAENIKNADIVVYTAAISENNTELLFAQKNAIPTIERKHLLSEISRVYDFVIAVAGTHGKTTVTGMLCSIFDNANLCFTAHLGGKIVDGIGNLIFKGYNYFITEACEYQRSLLTLKPDVAVILNVEQDHPDTYATIGELYATFDQFLKGIRKNGTAVIAAESEYYNIDRLPYNHISNITSAHIYKYGVEGNLDIEMRSIICDDKGCFGCRLKVDGSQDISIKLRIPGYHNLINAVAAYATCKVCGIDDSIIKTGLENFLGVERRFQHVGSFNNAEIFTDYAHHPTEIQNAIYTAMPIKINRLICVFQPHTYSRTSLLFEKFVDSFVNVHKLYIFKEYAAREHSSMGKTAFDLYTAIKAKQVAEIFYYDNLLSLAQSIKLELKPGDVLLILGAGDIHLLAKLINQN